MNFTLDGLTLLVLFLFAGAAYKRGFLTSVINLAGALVSAVSAVILSKPVAVGIYKTYISEGILTSLNDLVAQVGQSGIENFVSSVEEFAAQMPAMISGPIKELLEKNSQDWFYSLSTMSPQEFSATIATTVIEPLVIPMLQAVAFCVIFALLMVLVKVISRLLKGVNYIPILGSLNEILGGAIGLLQGCVFVFVAATILWLIITTSTDANAIITSQTIENTFVFKHFYNAGPWFDTIIKGI